MVSLGENFNMNSGSSRFAGLVEDDRDSLSDPVLGINEDGNRFTPVKTIPIFSFHLLISTSISLVGVILALKWPTDKRCEAYFVMLYLRGAFWLITWVFDIIVKRHHDSIRLKGFHDFHRSIAGYHGLPLFIVSLWNTTILVIGTLMHHLYGPDFSERCIRNFFNPISYITLFTITETIILIIFSGSYMGKVRNFNKFAPQPDALQGEVPVGSLGIYLPESETAVLLDKQADLIHFLKDHNAKLNQKLMQLNSQLRTLNASHT